MTVISLNFFQEISIMNEGLKKRMNIEFVYMADMIQVLKAKLDFYLKN